MSWNADVSSIPSASSAGSSLTGLRDRVEALDVEVAIVDLVASLAQRRHHALMQCGREAVGERMGVNDEDAHSLRLRRPI